MNANENNRNGNGSMNTTPVAESSEPAVFARTDSRARTYRWRGESGTRHPVCNANCRQGS